MGYDNDNQNEHEGHNNERFKRHPLAIAWDEWLASDEGKEADDPATLGRAENSSTYLTNRLHRAFDAGANVRVDHAPHSLKWTKEFPQESGVYWWRSGPDDDPELYDIDITGDCVYGLGSSELQTIEEFNPHEGEYQGPITPAVDHDPRVEQLTAERDNLLNILETRAERELGEIDGEIKS